MLGWNQRIPNWPYYPDFFPWTWNNSSARVANSRRRRRTATTETSSIGAWLWCHFWWAIHAFWRSPSNRCIAAAEAEKTFYKMEPWIRLKDDNNYSNFSLSWWKKKESKYDVIARLENRFCKLSDRCSFYTSKNIPRREALTDEMYALGVHFNREQEMF